MIIREERVSDYAQIAELHALAFENSGSQQESVLVALLRQERGYNPRLSRIMELDGEIIGHVMVTPNTFQLNNEQVLGGILAPLGVHPEWQGKGVGTKLMESVHQEAAELGLAFIALLGHDSYYPRFGYKTHQFGVANLEVSIPNSANLVELEVRKPNQGDLQALQQLWAVTNHGVPLCLRPSPALNAWYSTNQEIRSQVYLEQGKIVGYTRIHEASKQIKAFLAKDEEMARAVLSKLSRNYNLENIVTIPLHPTRLDWFEKEAKSSFLEVWSAGMICPIKDNKQINTYIKKVEQSQRNAGQIQWPVAFEAI